MNLSVMTAVTAKGEFKRPASVFRNFIEEGGKYPPASGRYRLYVSYACPWASRCLALRRIKGLEDVIELVIVDPVFGRTKPGVDDHEGWLFNEQYPDPDGHTSIRALYETAMRNLGGEPFDTRFTVPVLFDTVSGTIVNNESSEIIRIFNSAFNAFARHPEADMAPAEAIGDIDRVGDWVYAVCNGVYECGFAQSQEAYDAATERLFGRLDEIEELLGHQRFLVGLPAVRNQPTEADVRLFMSCIRFPIYVVHFKCCFKQIHIDYPNIRAWMRDVYQTLDLAPVVNFDHCKNHYFRSHRSINVYQIVPKLFDIIADVSAPHDRAAKFSS